MVLVSTQGHVAAGPVARESDSLDVELLQDVFLLAADVIQALMILISLDMLSSHFDFSLKHYNKTT